MYQTHELRRDGYLLSTKRENVWTCQKEDLKILTGCLNASKLIQFYI